jgi:hypothetical protein
VYSDAGKHKKELPLMACDVEMLTHDLTVDENYKEPLKQVPIVRSSKYEESLPEKGDIALIEFPYWLGNQGIIRGFLYDKKNVLPEAKTYSITGVEKIKLGGEDEQVVLGLQLKSALEALSDVFSGQLVDPNSGQVLPDKASEIASVKGTFENFLSTSIKIKGNGS